MRPERRDHIDRGAFWLYTARRASLVSVTAPVHISNVTVDSRDRLDQLLRRVRQEVREEVGAAIEKVLQGGF